MGDSGLVIGVVLTLVLSIGLVLRRNFLYLLRIAMIFCNGLDVYFRVFNLLADSMEIAKNTQSLDADLIKGFVLGGT